MLKYKYFSSLGNSEFLEFLSLSRHPPHVYKCSCGRSWCTYILYTFPTLVHICNLDRTPVHYTKKPPSEISFLVYVMTWGSVRTTDMNRGRKSVQNIRTQWTAATLFVNMWRRGGRGRGLQEIHCYEVFKNNYILTWSALCKVPIHHIKILCRTNKFKKQLFWKKEWKDPKKSGNTDLDLD